MLPNSQKIVFVIPPLPGQVTKEHLPILGVGYIAAVLEKNGYEVKIIDSIVNNYSNEETIRAVLKELPQAVGVTCSTSNRFNAVDIIEGVKQNNKNIFIFAGGRHFHHTWLQALNKVSAIDVVVRGEGELTSLELLNAYFGKKDFRNILGIAYRANGHAVVNKDRPVVQNLDELPWPAWHLYELDKYTARLEGEKKTRSVGVISSRGCPNLCTFCANASFWNTLRLRSPKNFVDEVEMLHRDYGYRAFDFWDDTMTIVKSHILDICSEIIKRKLDIAWYARARVNTVDEEILSAMKKAGCRIIGFGVESGSEQIIKNVKKNITLEQVKKTFYLCAKLGLVTKAFFIFGLPGEKEDDIIKTQELMMELKSYGAKFKSQVLVLASLGALLYPGTKMFEEAIEGGYLSCDFDWFERIHLKKNVDLGIEPTIPIWESKILSPEQILEINKKFDRKILTVLRKAYYHYRISSCKEFLKKLHSFYEPH